MGIETRGIPGVNNGEDFFSAETILDDPTILTILNKYTGGSGKDAIPEKDAILEEIVSQLNNHPESQESFIIDLFDDLAREGEGEEEWVQTNRRDGAFEILTSQAMEPIIKGNSTVVSYAYLEAISLQGQQNDSLAGSIYTLLEIGKAIAPYFPIDSGLKKKIITAWERVIKEFLWQEEKSYMQLELKEIKYIMSPLRIFDDQVEQLVLGRENTSNFQIAKKLGVSSSKVESSRERLLVKKRIEPREDSSLPTFREQDNQVKELIEKGLSDSEIAKELDISLFKTRSSWERLAILGKVGPREHIISQALIERDNQVAELVKKGFTNREIAKKLGASRFQIRSSCGRLAADGRIKPRRHGRSQAVIQQEGESSSSQNYS